MEIHDYNIKDQEYFENVRLDVAAFIEQGKNLNVLDIGGGQGKTLLYLKNRGIASEIHLFDIVDQVKDKTQFNSVTIGDINKTDLYDDLHDVIILSDVLEHMVYPDIAFNKALEKLKINGKLLISLPNIRFIKAMYKIFMKGSFEYENSGIFDKTHMRFYCKSDMIKLINNQKGLLITKSVSVNKFVKSKTSLVDRLTLGIFSELLTVQYLFEVKKIA